MEENDWWISFLLHFFFIIIVIYSQNVGLETWKPECRIQSIWRAQLSPDDSWIYFSIVLSPPANQALV